MSLAWETTVEDVANVLRYHGVSGNAEAILDEHFDDSVCGRIEKAVLRCNDFDEQADAAFEEIETVLADLGILAKTPANQGNG